MDRTVHPPDKDLNNDNTVKPKTKVLYYRAHVIGYIWLSDTLPDVCGSFYDIEVWICLGYNS